MGEEQKERPRWDEYFMEVSEAIAKRATCDRGRSGCVIAREKQILSTGYVGSPPGLPHCDEVGHQMRTVIDEEGQESRHCVRTIHAEQNAICQAARNGVVLQGASLYCRMTPCYTCAMLIASCSISEVHCQKRYHKARASEELLRQCGIPLYYQSDQIEAYPDQ